MVRLLGLAQRQRCRAVVMTELDVFVSIEPEG